MIDLGTLADLRLLHLAEIANLGAFGEVRAGAQAGKGTDGRVGFDMRAFQMGKGMDHRAALHRHARTENHIGFDQGILADHRIMGQEHRFRRNHGHAGQHDFAALAFLPQAFEHGEFSAGITAGHFLLGGRDHDGATTARPRDLHEIRQIIFALGIAIADTLQKIEGLTSVDSHDAAIAPLDRPFSLGSILLLTDGDQLPVFCQKAAIAGWGIRLKTNDHDVVACRERTAGLQQRFGRDQRHIAINDDHVVISRRNRFARRQNGMAGAKTFFLKESLDRHTFRCGGRRYLIGVTTDDQCRIANAGSVNRSDNVRNHRQAGNRVQNLRKAGFHPRTVASGENDCQTTAFHENALPCLLILNRSRQEASATLCFFIAAGGACSKAIR